MFIDEDVTTTPKVKRDIYGERERQCDPEPNVFAPDAPLEMVFAYPAPILTGLSKISLYPHTPEEHTGVGDW
jgi:hypothetical protein